MWNLKIVLNAFLLLAPLGIGGWWSDPPGEQYQEPATLVIYRKPNVVFTKFGLSLNEKQIIPNLEMSTFYVITAPPGKVLLETKGNIFTEKKEYTLTLEPGETYYLEALLEYQAYLTTMHLVKRSEGVTKEAVKRMERVNVKATN